MTNSLKVVQVGSNPLASDNNQYAQMLSGLIDVGQLSLVGPQPLPGPPSIASGSSAGNLLGSYLYRVVLITGWKQSDGSYFVSGFAPSLESSTFVAGILNPSSALSLSASGNGSSLTATTFYVQIDYTDNLGRTTTGSSQASITVTAGQNITLSVTLPTNATAIGVYVGTASNPLKLGDISSSGSVTYSGSSTSGLSATVSGSTLSITISAAASNTGSGAQSGNTTSTQASLSSVATGTSAVIGRAIYRTKAGGSSGSEQFVGIVWDNTTTTFTDNVADSSIGTGMPTSSSYPAVYGTTINANVPNTNTTGTFLFQTQNPNLIINPTGRQNLLGWTVYGGTWTSQYGVHGEGGFFNIGNASNISSVWYLDSVHVPCVANQPYTLSGEIFTGSQTAGSAYLELHAFNSSGGDLGVLGTVSVPNNQDYWESINVTGITPSNAAFISARLVLGSGTTTTNTSFRRIKLEQGNVATSFSDDQNMNMTQFSSSFYPSSLNTTGYLKLPTGFIIQWDVVALTANTWSTWTYPISFPNKMLSIGGLMETTTVGAGIIVGSPSASSSQLQSSVTANAHIMAIGY